MIYKRRTIDRTMFYGANVEIFKFAEELRQDMTEAELVLWNKLRQNKLSGYRFKAQHPIKSFITDFYCHKAKLVIEIDGVIHNTKERKEYDMNRSYEFEQLGLTVLRFTNNEVINKTDWVLEQISNHFSESQ